MTTFDNIKKISKKRGYNLRQTAEKAGLSPNAIYRYNQGIEPKYATLKAIADVLKVSISELSSEYSKDTQEPAEELDTKEKTKHVNVEDLVDGTAMLTSRDGALSEEDRAAMKAMLVGYLTSKEGRERLKKYSNIELNDTDGENGDD